MKTTSISKDDLFQELDYYFSTLPHNKNYLNVFREVEVGDEKEEQEFLRIEKTGSEPSNFAVVYGNSEAKSEITNESLAKSHLHLTLLYDTIKEHNDKVRRSKLDLIPRIKQYFAKPVEKNVADPEGTFVYEKLKRTRSETLLLPFTYLNRGLKWVARQLILDNFISKYTIGWIVATIANKGNPHYKIKANSLTALLGPLIFPAGLMKPQISNDGEIHLGPILGEQFDALRKYNERYPDDSLFSEFTVRVNKDTLLTGVTASNQLVSVENPDHLHLLYFNGNSGCYQADAELVDKDLIEYEKDNQAVTAIQFNYPGILNSSGKAEQADDLIQAGIAQIERLNKKFKIPYEKIGLHGVSLGGSVASHVASYYFSRGIELNGLYASKTFSTTTNVAVSYVHKIPYVGPFLGFLFRPFIIFGLWASRWMLDTAAKFTSLPEGKGEYSVVRSPKNIRDSLKPKDDPVLVHYAGLHESWRLRLQRFFHKRGWFGYNSETYTSMKHERKMSVFHRQPAEEEFDYCPHICGHSKANFHYNDSNIALFHRPGAGKPNDLSTAKKFGLESGRRVRLFFTHRDEVIGTKTVETQNGYSA